MFTSVLLSILFTFPKFRIQIQKNKSINLSFMPKTIFGLPSDNDLFLYFKNGQKGAPEWPSQLSVCLWLRS